MGHKYIRGWEKLAAVLRVKMQKKKLTKTKLTAFKENNIMLTVQNGSASLIDQNNLLWLMKHEFCSVPKISGEFLPSSGTLRTNI